MERAQPWGRSTEDQARALGTDLGLLARRLKKDVKVGGALRGVGGLKHLHPATETVRAWVGVTQIGQKEVDGGGAPAMPGMEPGIPAGLGYRNFEATWVGLNLCTERGSWNSKALGQVRAEAGTGKLKPSKRDGIVGLSSEGGPCLALKVEL